MPLRGKVGDRNKAGQIEIRHASFKNPFRIELGEALPTVSGGGAIYEEVTRPEQQALSLYTGTGLLRVDVPVIFDGWPDEGVWDDVRRVMNLCQGEGTTRSPDFVVVGPIPYSGERFVMEQPEWGDRVVSKNGDLVRQWLTLKLVEWVDPNRLRPHKVGQKNRGGGHNKNGGTTAPPRTVTVHDHETLLQIAANIYGDSTVAKAIGRLNGIRDIRKPLKQGTKITLPKGYP